MLNVKLLGLPNLVLMLAGVALLYLSETAFWQGFGAATCMCTGIFALIGLACLACERG